MQTKKLAAAIAVLAVLTACSGPDEGAAVVPPRQTPTVTPSAPSEPEPVVTPEVEVVTGPPVECESPAPAGSEGPVAAAAATAALPESVTLRLGVQVIDSVDEAGMVEAVARICSEPLSKDELTTVATTIAQAVYADPSHETVALLKVSSWVPVSDGSDALTQDQSLDTDFQMYLWDADPSLLPSNWTHNP